MYRSAEGLAELLKTTAAGQGLIDLMEEWAADITALENADKAFAT